MSGARVLLVSKQPMAHRLSPDDLERVARCLLPTLQAVQAAAEDHARSLALVRASLHRQHVRERLVTDLQPGDADEVDLVVTVGGDGTVFAANGLRADRPLITVNSDPTRSVGHFTRCRADGFAALFAAWLAGSAGRETIPRLQVSIDGWRSARCILNDCLFTSRNPAAISRYTLGVGTDCEAQRSSGVWVATAAGSTGGIRSAGGDPPLPPGLAALLFRVREPFQGREPVRLTEGRQLPPVGLALTATMPEIDLYIDGPHACIPMPFGATAEFAANPQPLTLVIPGPST